jgi:outer membrane protein assembly factor BamD
MRKALSIIIYLFISSLIFSCAHDTDKIKPAQELYDEATGLAKKGDVEKAAEAFMQVRTYYPGHELARKAIFNTADLYYDQEDYELALKNYEEFRLLYPTDIDAGYCLFRIGMCHYKQMGTLDRDQNETLKAIQSLEAFLKTYPGSPYIINTTDSLKEAKTLLAKHYVYIGKFYLKKGNSKAACSRFQSIKKQFPDTDLGEDIDSLISTSCNSSVPDPK